MAILPVVFVHGIQGAWLKDEYPVDYNDAVLWTGILRKDFNDLHLHGLDAGVDRDVQRQIMPHQAVPLIYANIVDEIRDEMEDRPYAYVFTYDWRKDNRLAARALARFIDRILHIAGVHEKAAGRKPPQQVVLIGHSMGGLVIKWCATQIIRPRTIAKIITIATPYKGSLKAIEALLPGARNLFGCENKKSMRHACRTLPGVYQLLPTWPEAVVDSRSGGHLDPFDVGSWQKGLVTTLQEQYSADFFPNKLADARQFTEIVGQPWPEDLRNKVYYAYGIGSNTWRQVRVDRTRDNLYLFDEAVADDQGDGTVHACSGSQDEITGRNREHIDKRNPVRDLVAGQHANMPNHPHLQDWVLGLLRMNDFAKKSFASPV